MLNRRALLGWFGAAVAACKLGPAVLSSPSEPLPHADTFGEDDEVVITEIWDRKFQRMERFMPGDLIWQNPDGTLSSSSSNNGGHLAGVWVDNRVVKKGHFTYRLARWDVDEEA